MLHDDQRVWHLGRRQLLRFWAPGDGDTGRFPLKVQTRYHTNSITLGVELHLRRSSPEKIFDEDNGLWAVPSPQIRAIFALYTKIRTPSGGAHYVTAAEEANGALPFHGFNFVLVLQPYDAVSSCNDDNLGTQVFMVPATCWRCCTHSCSARSTGYRSTNATR